MPKVKKILITTESREVLIIRGNRSKARTDSDAFPDIIDAETIDLEPTVVEQPESAREAQWMLTAEAFQKFLACLDPDRDRAGEKYLLLRRNLVRFFEGRGFYEAEDASDEVVNRLARKLEAGGEIENVNQYSYGVARMVALELYKKRTREQKAFSELPTEQVDQPDTDENECRLAALNNCLGELPPEARELILAYYTGDGGEKIKNRQALAARLGIPQNALRSRAVRLRDRLKLLLDKNSDKQSI